ncbi:MAG: transglutaminase domain-containing protein [Armatimonadetes bacterium]|nr:transglutaminase domain-containing protein [Armatimonadota bacterium]MDE2207122.1 transglutaminase domain-containing protein [Armatimonadota bacterium]
MADRLQPDRLPDAEPAERLPAPAMYLGGLSVTLAGIYAVNYGLADTSFLLLTSGLAVLGYSLSFTMRRLRIAVGPYPTYAAIAVWFYIYLTLSGAHSDSAFAPFGASDDRGRLLQLVFLWLGVLHSFTLTTDEWVLFSCVPSLTMLSLVSTATADVPVQYAFFVFIIGSTVMLVHENFLRTQRAVKSGAALETHAMRFGGQAQLVLVCVVAGFAVASVLQAPVEVVGQALALPAAMRDIARNAPKPLRKLVPDVSVGEQFSVNIDDGPVTSSDQPLMEVTSGKPYYWRGATFDQFSGHSFTNNVGQAAIPLSASPGGAITPPGPVSGPRPDEVDAGSSANVFTTPSNPTDPDARSRRNAVFAGQFVHIVNGSFNQIYGAGTILQVRGVMGGVTYNQSEGLEPSTALGVDAVLYVLSRVPDSDPAILRSVGAAPAYPPEVANFYLQTQTTDPAGDARLQAVASQTVAGISNEYDKVMALQHYVSSSCKYNLSTPAAPRNVNVAAYFLFQSREGYCDSFAAALTMLCRYAGIPARVASGFLPGTHDPRGYYVVREKDKHLWTEVYFPHVGWVPFDATAGAALAHGSAAGSNGRREPFLRWLVSHGPLPIFAGAAIIALLGIVAVTEARNRLSRVASARAWHAPASNRQILVWYGATCDLLATCRIKRPESLTPDEWGDVVAARIGDNHIDARTAFLRLTQLCSHYRYSNEVADAQDVASADKAYRLLRTAMPAIRREMHEAQEAPQA